MEGALRALLAPSRERVGGLSVAADRVDPSALAEVTEAEARAVARAVPARRHEFATGRRVARRALQELGLGSVEIPRDPKTRAPIWPRGVVGSITHSGQLCAAVVARGALCRGVGLDAEPDAPLEDALRPIVLTDVERQTLADGPEAARRLRWTFSAKEAFYKAQHPLTGRFLEFTDVELAWTFDPDAPARADFRAQCRVPDSEEVAARGVGRLAIEDGWVLTTFVVPS